MIDFFTRRTVLALIIVVLVAPILGWVAASYVKSQPNIPAERSTDEIKSKLEEFRASAPSSFSFPDFVITNVRHIDNWWYVVDVTYNNTAKTKAKAVLSDFGDSYSGLTVVIAPGQKPPTINTSSSNIPYGILDEIDRFWGLQP